MEADTVGGPVVEAILCREDVVAIVVEPGLSGERVANADHAIEEGGQLVMAGEIGAGAHPKRALANDAIALEQVWLEGGYRLHLTVPDDRQAAGDLVIGGFHLLERRHAWQVLLAKDRDVGPRLAQENGQ